MFDVTILLIAGAIALIFFWWMTSRRPPGLPPSPGYALPLLGHVHLIKKDPFAQFEGWRRQFGDIFSLYFGSQLVIVLNGYDNIKEALVKRGDAFSSRPNNVLDTLIFKDKGIVHASGSHWKEQKKVSLEILKELGLGKNILAERIQEEVTRYIKALDAYQGQALDIDHLTKVSVSNNICSVVFGKRFEYDDPVIKVCIKIIHDFLQDIQVSSSAVFFPFLLHIPGDLFGGKRLIANMRHVEDIFYRPQIERHKATYTDGDESDFIYLYLREMKRKEVAGQPTTMSDKCIKDSGSLIHFRIDYTEISEAAMSCSIGRVPLWSEDNMREDILLHVVGDLFLGGTNATSTTICWAVLLLLHHPDIQEKCFQEIVQVIGTERAPRIQDKQEIIYVEATIMEVLRWADITPFGGWRGLYEDINFGNYSFPKEAVIIINLESVLKDPEIWSEPQVFNPERFIGADGQLIRREEFIPFTMGRRMCLGESMARMELFLYLTSMIQKFRFLPAEHKPLPSLKGCLGSNYSPKPFEVRVMHRVQEK